MATLNLLCFSAGAALLAFSAPAASVLYVDGSSTNPVPPYADWSTAATNIQDAVDGSSAGDLVLVMDGVYRSGGRTVNGFALTNRLVVDKAITVQSVNGPGVTLIEGYQMAGSRNGDAAVRCAYLTNNAVLSGFTLTNGATRASTARTQNSSGGGIWCEDSSALVSNCVLSANSADFTYGVGGGGAGGTYAECMFAGNSAKSGGGVYNGILENCILTNNSASSSGGGAWSSTLVGCVLVGNSASSAGGGAAGSTLTDCVVTNNSATSGGGGSYAGVLNHCLLAYNSTAGSGGGASSASATNCTFIGNRAANGGGAYSATLANCSLAGNMASYSGGGSYSSTLVGCAVTGNSAPIGGGANAGALANCFVSGNIALATGGGANGATLTGSAVCENSALGSGGGAEASTLNNCTLAGNSASTNGGAHACALTNCIVYYNIASQGPNHGGGTLAYCCTTPLPASGPGNLEAEPGLSDLFHLSSSSPCRGAGNAALATGLDIDGQPWATPPAIGCDEADSGSVTGPLSVAIQAVFTNLATGFAGNFTAQITGHASLSVWDFGDGVRVTNRPCATHTWTAPGQYPVSVWAFNDSAPAGTVATLTIQVVDQPVQYVALANANPSAPYCSWATAATNIQDALDVAFGGGLILVGDGAYQTGGRPAPGGTLTNRITSTRPVTLQSVNGPAATAIVGCQVPGSVDGDSAVRCAFLGDGSSLSGFTLANGATRSILNATSNPEFSGGGAWCQSTNVRLSNCVVVSNACAVCGGGVCAGTLSGCQISGNSVHQFGSFGGGGGLAGSIASDSLITSNSAVGGSHGAGGALACSLSNCLVGANLAGGASGSFLTACIIENNTNHNFSGGGVAQSVLSDCVVRGNWTDAHGGGAFDCVLNNCVVSNNWAAGSGGGVYEVQQTAAPGQGNLVVSNSASSYGGGLCLSEGASSGWKILNWTFMGNSSSRDGGGMYMAVSLPMLISCSFTGNTSSNNGGGLCCPSGSSPVIVSNSIFSGNRATGTGGGAYSAALNNCTLTGNRAANGGGAYGIATNCVFNNNVATGNGGGLSPSDTGSYYAPVIMSGCAFTNNAAANGGGSYGGIFYNGVFSGNSALTNGGATYAAALSGCLLVSNRALFGGGAFAPSSTPRYPPIRSYTYLDCQILGNSAQTDGGGLYSEAFMGTAGTNCLLQNNTAGNNGGGLFSGTLINSTICGNSAGNQGGGAYNAGISYSSLSNNVARADGGGLYYNAFMGPAGTSCLLQNNTAGNNGGGLFSGTLTKSTLCGNSAGNQGGGAYNARISYSSIFNNVARTNGGGACSGTLVNDLVTGNSAAIGGGAYGGSLDNSTLVLNQATVAGGGCYSLSGSSVTSCIIYDNSAPSGANYSGNPACDNCCTTPLPSLGSQNITSDPSFVDLAGGNFRLQTNSPCINAGGGASWGSVDLDGRPRIVGGKIDIGAYEFQGSGMGEFIVWLQQHGLATGGSADYVDTDGDGLNNWQEWIAGTDPADPLSVLKMLPPALVDNPAVVVVSWQSVSNRTYFLQECDNLLVQPAFSSIQSNIVGQVGITRWTNSSSVGHSFYRVGIQ